LGALWFLATLSSRTESDNVDRSVWSREWPESELERKRPKNIRIENTAIALTIKTIFVMFTFQPFI